MCMQAQLAFICFHTCRCELHCLCNPNPVNAQEDHDAIMSFAPAVSHCSLLGKGHRDIRLRTPPKAGQHALPLLQARNLLFGACSRSSHSTAARRAGIVVKSAGTAPFVGEWQLVVLCAAVTQMSSSQRAGGAAAADLEGTASFLAQVRYRGPCCSFHIMQTSTHPQLLCCTSYRRCASCCYRATPSCWARRLTPGSRSCWE